MVSSLCSRLSQLLCRFRRERKGNVAITFALASIPIMGFVGAAIDYSHANAVRVALQSALDSAALMLAKEAANLSGTDLDDKAVALCQRAVQPHRRDHYQDQGHLYAERRNERQAGRLRRRSDQLHRHPRPILRSPRVRRHYRVQLVDRQMGHHKAARGAGARQYRLDGAGRQDRRAQDRHQEPAEAYCKTPRRPTATSRSRIIPFANGVNVGTDNVDADVAGLELLQQQRRLAGATATTAMAATAATAVATATMAAAMAAADPAITTATTAAGATIITAAAAAAAETAPGPPAGKAPIQAGAPASTRPTPATGKAA